MVNKREVIPVRYQIKQLIKYMRKVSSLELMAVNLLGAGGGGFMLFIADPKYHQNKKER